MPDYLVKVKAHQQDSAAERLVRAKNEARAIAHVVKDTVTIDRASTDDVIRLTAAGVKLEVAPDAEPKAAQS